MIGSKWAVMVVTMNVDAWAVFWVCKFLDTGHGTRIRGCGMVTNLYVYMSNLMVSERRIYLQWTSEI